MHVPSVRSIRETAMISKAYLNTFTVIVRVFAYFFVSYAIIKPIGVNLNELSQGDEKESFFIFQQNEDAISIWPWVSRYAYDIRCKDDLNMLRGYLARVINGPFRMALYKTGSV